jgi:hypothetical protein
MGDKDKIFSSAVKHNGIFNFAAFYKFCYDWLKDEFGLDPVAEDKYGEKLVGDAKEINVEWTGTKKMTDYFKYHVKVEFKVLGLTKIELNQNGAKIDTNKGSVEIKVKGILEHDYDGKFDSSPTKAFMRGIYEKWVIKARVKALEGKLAADCDEFLTQAKAYLDLEGKK